MALRIACDLDGTLADMDAALRREAVRLFPELDGRDHRLTDRQRRQLWDRVTAIEDFWTTLDEVEPGAVKRLAALAEAHRWEVIFLTQRPASNGETAQRQSQRWLHAHGFGYPSVFVMQGPRAKAVGALGIDVLVDDHPNHCVEVVTSSDARALLVWRRPASALPPEVEPLGVQVLSSFDEALAQLEDMTARLAKQPGMLSRLRNAIGWQ